MIARRGADGYRAGVSQAAHCRGAAHCGGRRLQARRKEKQQPGSTADLESAYCANGYHHRVSGIAAGLNSRASISITSNHVVRIAFTKVKMPGPFGERACSQWVPLLAPWHEQSRTSSHNIDISGNKAPTDPSRLQCCRAVPDTTPPLRSRCRLCFCAWARTFA